MTHYHRHPQIELKPNNKRNNPSSIADPNQTINLPNDFNIIGEAVLPEAPYISLGSHLEVIPQQFFHYQRTRENIEEIVRHISFDDNFPIFVHQENGCLFLQVGIIGHENYPKGKITTTRPKIVYGRRWFIEPYMPTSEVIQTALVALQKAREHELREHFYMMIEDEAKTYKTTPFNTHLDLPLMADSQHLFKELNNTTRHKLIKQNKDLTPNTKNLTIQSKLEQLISEQLLTLRFDRLHFRLTQLSVLDTLIVVTIALDEPNHKKNKLKNQATDNTDNTQMAHFFPEQINRRHHLTIDIPNIDAMEISPILNKIVYSLFDFMLMRSNQYVCDNFYYKGFARFDSNIPAEKIAIFSAKTRLVDTSKKTPAFIRSFKKMVETVDSYKAPMYAKNLSLYNRQRQAINAYSQLEGYLPYFEMNKHTNNTPKSFNTPSNQSSNHTDNDNQEHISEIIAMAWCDDTSFDDIKLQTGLSEKAVIHLMRHHLKPSSFKLWRKRVSGRINKHNKIKRQVIEKYDNKKVNYDECII